MKKTVIIVVVLVILAAGAVMMNRSTPQKAVDNIIPEDSAATQLTASSTQELLTATTTGASTTVKIAPNVKTFTVVGENFTFDKKELRVKKGDTVKIVFKNEQGFHDWRVDEFKAATKKIGAGQTDTITFTASAVGTFEYYCSVGEHRQMGMRGNLIVE